MFPCARRKGRCFRKEYIEHEQCWEEAAPALVGSKTVTFKKKNGELLEVQRPTMTWYEATHHSFVSRHVALHAPRQVSLQIGWQ